VKIDEGQQKKKNRPHQPTIKFAGFLQVYKGSCQSTFSLCRHHPNQTLPLLDRRSMEPSKPTSEAESGAEVWKEQQLRQEILRIQDDTSLTAQDKAKKIQKLMTRRWKGADQNGESKKIQSPEEIREMSYHVRPPRFSVLEILTPEAAFGA